MANIAKGDLGVKSPLQKKKKISPLESFKLLNNLMHFNTSAPQKKKIDQPCSHFDPLQYLVWLWWPCNDLYIQIDVTNHTQPHCVWLHCLLWTWYRLMALFWGITRQVVCKEGLKGSLGRRMVTQGSKNRVLGCPRARCLMMWAVKIHELHRRTCQTGHHKSQFKPRVLKCFWSRATFAWVCNCSS